MDLRLTLAVVCWSLLVVLALIPLFKGSFTEGSRWRVTMGLFALLLGCSLVTWRWRSLTYDGEINVDESQLLSQAMRFMLDPLPWRSVDGGSSGPLNTWVLMWAPLLGLKFSYLTARITSLFCVWNIFVAMGLAISEVARRRIALALVLPSATFILTTTNFDFVFLSSEQLPSAISAWAIYLITLQIKTPRRWVAYWIGFLLGALPFCKIQVGPAGVFLFAGSTCVWLARLGRSKEAWRGILIQCAGGLTVPFLILGPVMMCGAGTEFYEFYIRTALSYRNSGNMMQKMDVPSLVFAVKEFGVLTVSVLTLAVVGMVWRQMERRRGSNDPFYWGMLVFAAAYVLLTAGSILRTGYPFPHYLMLLIVPGLAMLGTAFSGSFGTSKGGPVGEGRQTSDGSWFAARGIAVFGVAVVVALAVQASAAFGDISKNSRLMADWGSGIHPIAGVIRGQLKPGDTVAVWGWAPKFNVMSEAPPAFRFSQSLFLLDESPWFAEVRPFFLTRFMADLEKSRPRLFIDAPDEFMWPGYPQGTMARHWVIPVLSEFIRKNYSLIGTMPSPPGKAAIMVYRLKEA